MNNVEIILGTAQLGMDYGINNQYGKPNENDAQDILNFAFQSGIEILDTAHVYGDSEKVIGNYHSYCKKKFKICTKLPFEDNFNEDNTKKAIMSSLRLLAVDNLYVMYMHRFEQIYNESIVGCLREMKKYGLVDNIGISLYTPEELKIIVEKYADFIDIVQIPFNILDNVRWSQIFQQAKNKSIKVYTRSVFLQGLLFMDTNSSHVRNLKATEYLYYVRKLADRKKVSITKLMLDFNKSFDIDGILVGCETKEQLKKNVDCFHRASCIKAEDVYQIEKQVSGIDVKIIDPRQW